MPIDPDFQKNRKKVGKEEGIAMREPVDPPVKLGIRGTYVGLTGMFAKVAVYVLRFVQCSCTSGWNFWSSDLGEKGFSRQRI